MRSGNETNLGYLEQMLEKGGGFAVGIFLEGLVLSQDCRIQTPIYFPVTHCLQQGDNICKGLYMGLCPKYGGLFH